jgi:hypothetical protein
MLTETRKKRINAAMARLITLLLTLLALAAPAAYAQPAAPAEVQVGAYILRISGVSQKEGSFDADMWVWLRWQGAGLTPHKSIDIANGVIENRTETAVLDDEGYSYTTVRLQAKVFHRFDVRRFPLDDHRLAIEFEDSTFDASTLRYVADRGTALDPGLAVPGWQVALGKPAVTGHVYPTDYGLRASKGANSVYSRLTVPVELKREGYGALFKQFWISLLAVTLALLSLLVRSNDLDARFGLGVGSIFAASANAFVLSDVLPHTTAVTLAEQINLVAVGTIFFCVFVSIRSLRLRYEGREADSLRLDRRALWVIGLAWLAVNLVLVLR